MARGRKTTLTLHLTLADRQTLLAWQWAKTRSVGPARRDRIIILLADHSMIKFFVLDGLLR